MTTPSDPLRTRLAGEARKSGLFSPGRLTITRAPGRLDVMGGIADYSGSRVCQMTLAVSTAVAIQLRGDGRVICRSVQVGRTVDLPMAKLATDDPLAVRALLGEEDHWARYPVGCLWWLLQGGRPGCDGATLLVDSDVPLGGGVSSSAAIEVATMMGLTRVMGVAVDPLELAVGCQAVENRVVGAPCGVMDQVASCLGHDGAMLEILCQPGRDGKAAQVLGGVAIPPGTRFIGVHSGVRHEVRGDPYTDTRVAAFMAQKIVSVSATPDPTRGFLANLSVLSGGEYESRFRQMLPERIAGSAFLEKYRATNDVVTRVDPGREYHVRAAADHHVREMDRVTRFIELMREPGELEPRLRAAGTLMNQSHQSYSDNARLGHEHTDLLASMFREAGAGQGFYGAKITGGGGGGTVAVLLRDGETTRRIVEQIRKSYEDKTGRRTTLLEGSSDGAAYSPGLAVEIGGAR